MLFNRAKWPQRQSVTTSNSINCCCHDGARTTAFFHPHQSLSFDLNVSIKWQLFWPIRASFGQEHSFEHAAAINFLALSVPAVPTGRSRTIYNQHPYEAPHASAASQLSFSDIHPHLSSNALSKINLARPDLYQWRREEVAAKGRLDGGIPRDRGMKWED